MKIQTSKERRATILDNTIVPYQHPKAISGHVYMITHSKKDDLIGVKYYAVQNDASIWSVRLYNLGSGFRWSKGSTFGASDNEWADITDQVYLNTDELEGMK